MGKRNIFLYLFFTFLIFGGGFIYWKNHRYDTPGQVAALTQGIHTAYFAGGCFWCTEADFEKLPGVQAISGYSGGTTANPTYESVSSHTTGHIETVEVRYDPQKISYTTLVRYFFSHIDPTDAGGQFVDRGESYLSAVFYQSAEEERIVRDELKRLERSGAYEKPLVTLVRPFERFYIAEEYHQDYFQKNTWRYRYYRNASGRDQYLEKICAVRAERQVPCEKSTP